MLALIAIWAFAEAIVFFIVADVPIMALGIRAGFRKALMGALLAAVVAAVGGCAIYIWASTNPKDVIELFMAIPGIDLDLIAATHAHWNEGGALAMTVGSFSGVPYKLYALAAGAAPGSKSLAAIALFVLASILARLPRFLLVAAVAGWAGPRLTTRFGARAVWIAFALAWISFYLWYWATMGF